MQTYRLHGYTWRQGHVKTSQEAASAAEESGLLRYQTCWHPWSSSLQTDTDFCCYTTQSVVFWQVIPSKHIHWHTGRLTWRSITRLSHLYCGSAVNNLPANSGNTGSIPGSGRSPGEGNGNPLQYSCLENPMDRGAWRATVRGVAKESDTTEWLIPFHIL